MQSCASRKVAASQGPPAPLCPAPWALGAPVCPPCSHCHQIQASPYQSALQGKREAQLSPLCGQGQADPSGRGTSPMLQETLWALHWLLVQSIHVLPSQGQNPSARQVGFRDSFCSVSDVQQPQGPWCSFGKTRPRSSAALALPGLCPQEGAINHAPASAAPAAAPAPPMPTLV